MNTFMESLRKVMSKALERDIREAAISTLKTAIENGVVAVEWNVNVAEPTLRDHLRGTPGAFYIDRHGDRSKVVLKSDDLTITIESDGR